jgi:hypothetical protein
MGIAEVMNDVQGGGFGLLESTFGRDPGGVDTSSILKLMKKDTSPSIDEIMAPVSSKRVSESRNNDSISISKSELKALIREAVRDALEEEEKTPAELKKKIKTAVKDAEKAAQSATGEEIDGDTAAGLASAAMKASSQKNSLSIFEQAKRALQEGLYDDPNTGYDEPGLMPDHVSDEQDYDDPMTSEDYEDKYPGIDLEYDSGVGEKEAHQKAETYGRKGNPADSGVDGLDPKNYHGDPVKVTSSKARHMAKETVVKTWNSVIEMVNDNCNGELLEVVDKSELTSVLKDIYESHSGFSGLSEKKVATIMYQELSDLTESLGL